MKPADLRILNKHSHATKQLNLVDHQGDKRMVVLVTGKETPTWSTLYANSNAIFLNIDEIFQLRNKLNEWLIWLERRSNTERRS